MRLLRANAPRSATFSSAMAFLLSRSKEADMDRFRWIVAGIGVVIVAVLIVAIVSIVSPGSPPKATYADNYGGSVPASALLRVPVTGIYPGGSPAGLNPNMQNPLANDPDPGARGRTDFRAFN